MFKNGYYVKFHGVLENLLCLPTLYFISIYLLLTNNKSIQLSGRSQNKVIHADCVSKETFFADTHYVSLSKQIVLYIHYHHSNSD